MIIDRVPVGDLSENCYILSRDELSAAVLIDPGEESEKIRAALGKRPVEAILLTHGHFDHIGALDDFPDVPVYIHPQDAEMLPDPQKNGSASMGYWTHVARETLPAEDGDTFTLAGIGFTVWHTPGHSRGSVCYRAENSLFTGDTLFHRGFGRCDLYGGDFHALRLSLRRILTCPEDLPFYPGHGDGNTLSNER